MQVKIDLNCPHYYKERVKRKGLKKVLELLRIIKPLYHTTPNHVVYVADNIVYMSRVTATSLGYVDGQVIDMEKEFYKGL